MTIFINTQNIDSTHQIVWTNVPGNTIAERFKKPSVVIIKKGSPYHNGLAISSYFQKGDILLYSDQIPLFIAICINETAQRWTSVEDIKKALSLHKRVWIVEEHAGSLLIPLIDKGIPHVYIRKRTVCASNFLEGQILPLKS